MFSSGLSAWCCGFQTREEGRSLLNAPAHTFSVFTTSGKHFLVSISIYNTSQKNTTKVREFSLLKDNKNNRILVLHLQKQDE